MNPWVDFQPLAPPAPDAPYAEAAPENRRPPVVFLHGFMMSRALWADNLEHLRTFTRPILVELLGHGRSPAPERDAAYDAGQYITALEAYRAMLGYERWLVCGHSLGAGIALRYATEKPKRVAGVIFTNTRSAFSNMEDEAPERVGALQQLLQHGGEDLLETLPYHPKRMKRISDRTRNALISDARLVAPAAVAKTALITSRGVNIGHCLDAIRCPFLLVNGNHERAFQPIRHALEKSCPAITIEDVDAGHSASAEVPDVFNSSFERFVRALYPELDAKSGSWRHA
jgi:pimeloyl-ACP methyl ester carboxylesterase